MIIGDQFFLDAMCGLAQGLQIAIFLKAAGSDTQGTGTGTGTGFTINLTVGPGAFEHHLAKAMGARPAPLDPNDPHNKCETADGTPVDPVGSAAADCFHRP